jgi:isoleucyl-tRNA synthetase
MTLIEAFKTVCLTLAPIAPFVSEEIYGNLVGGGSVHLASWPKPGKINEKLGSEMEIAKKVFEAGSFARQKAGIKLRHPVRKITVVGGRELSSPVSSLSDVIKKQLNTKEVEYAQELPGTTYEAKPDFKVIGPKYGKEAVKVAEAIKKNPKEARKIVETKKKAKIDGFDVAPEMVSEIIVRAPEKYPGESFTVGGISGVVYVDTERDAPLIREALARELIRNIQELRKKHNLAELDRIKVSYTGGKVVDETLAEFGDVVLSEVRADEIKPDKKGATQAVFSFEGEEVGVSISF